MIDGKGARVRRVVIVAGLAATMLGLAGCGGTTPGQPGPATTTTGGSSGTNAPTTTTTNTSSVSLQQPCKLLSSSELQQLQITSPGESSTTAGDPTCAWTNDAGGVSATYLAKLGLADVIVTGNIKDTPVGAHKAREMRDSGGGGCLISLEVTAKSRVDLSAVDAHGDQNKACAMGEQFAALIEPKLPKS